MISNRITTNSSTNTSVSAFRSLALQGLVIEIIKDFDFIVNEDGDVCTQLEDDEFLDTINVNSITFEYLVRLYANSKGIDLIDDEYVATLAKIERFILSMESGFECDESTEHKEEVA